MPPVETVGRVERQRTRPALSALSRLFHLDLGLAALRVGRGRWVSNAEHKHPALDGCVALKGAEIYGIDAGAQLGVKVEAQEHFIGSVDWRSDGRDGLMRRPDLLGFWGTGFNGEDVHKSQAVKPYLVSNAPVGEV